GGHSRYARITVLRYSPPCITARRGIRSILIRSHLHRPPYSLVFDTVEAFYERPRLRFCTPAMNSILDQDNLGAFCRHTHVAVKSTGAGPLANLIFGVKDIYDVAGHKTGFGSPDWLATHRPATRTAPSVQILLDAGADLVGKTHTDELTYRLTGENAHYGTPINVNAPGRIPGGSSSGSAAAVAGRLVDFAVGSDTGGSVRAPASFCGIYGIRPT